MTAQLTIQFETADELDTWLAIFRKYNLEDKISIKSKKIKKNKPKAPETPTRNWSLIGSVSLNGALDNIPNLRDYAYED